MQSFGSFLSVATQFDSSEEIIKTWFTSVRVESTLDSCRLQDVCLWVYVCVCARCLQELIPSRYRLNELLGLAFVPSQGGTCAPPISKHSCLAIQSQHSITGTQRASYCCWGGTREKHRQTHVRSGLHQVGGPRQTDGFEKRSLLNHLLHRT